MKKKVFGRKLSRERDTRRALFRSLVKALVDNGQIVTTKAKAKAVQPLMEKLITISKGKDNLSFKKVYGMLANDKVTTEKLFAGVSDALRARTSGYTRLINLPRRTGDNAEMVRMEFTDKPVVGGPKAKKEVKGKTEVKEEKPAKKDIRSRVAGALKRSKK